MRQERGQIINGIRQMADSEPQNLQAQMGVAQGFLAANEPGEATGFADRAASIAQEKGDVKSLGAALTVGAVAYQKSGDYESALDRSKRALEIDPGNKMAMAVYQMSKGRSSGGSSSAPAASAGAGGGDRPAPVVGATSGSGRSGFPPATFASAAPEGAKSSSPEFIGQGTEKAIKLMGEASRKWSLDKAAAMKLLDQAVAADTRSAAVRLARARARLEMRNAAGALEDADAALVAGPSAEAHAMRGEALKALGAKQEDVLAAFKAAAELDGRFEGAYQAAIAASGAPAARADGASAPGAAGAMDEDARLRRLWPFGAAAALGLALIAYLLFVRRPGE